MSATLDQRTPTLRLKYSSDAHLNYNWEKLDDYAGVLSQTALVAGALQGVWIGNPDSSFYTLTPGQQIVSTVTTDPTELPTKWSVVVGQLTVEVQYGTPGDGFAQLDVGLHRATFALLTRTYVWATSAPVEGLDLDIPIVIPYLAQPGNADHIWRLSATMTATGGALIAHRFSQLWTVQFR